MAEGVLFTNLRALSRKFGTDAGAVRKLLAAYAEASLTHGIRYHIIDAADYAFINPEAGDDRRVSLSPSDSWVGHGCLLADYFRFGRSTSEDETNYLFIIGGNTSAGRPGGTLQTILMYIYQFSFESPQYGIASAGAMILFVLTFVITLINLKMTGFFKKKEA